MKISAITCEFNPFHNGHKYLLERVKERSGGETIICLMSGSFTQRGDICVSDKFTRARHAILGGADCVLELPSAFASAPAEIFAQGAIKILSSIPGSKNLAFGCETPDADFLNTAEILLNETESFKDELKNNMSVGESYCRSYGKALEKSGVTFDFKPNNLLALEYAKAVLRADADIKLMPVERKGAEYTDETLMKNFSSASAIRKNINSDAVKDNVPDFVFNDLRGAEEIEKNYKETARNKLFFSSAENLKGCFGCGEGLENALKSAQNLHYDEIVGKITSKRYSSSRIRRILCENLLDLSEKECKEYLNSDLYLRVLAVKKESADMVLSALSKADFPLIADGSFSVKKLSAEAEKCLGKDKLAHSLWNFIAKRDVNDKMILV